jgi:photosynthetic reaction center H subunit
MTVLGGDGERGGSVIDVWMDTSEAIARYLEIAVPMAGGGARNVLLPINFARIGRDAVRVHAIYGEHFVQVPGTRDPQQVTMLEEEKIMAFYGAGLLYADPERAEPLF